MIDYQLWSQDAEASLIGGILLDNYKLPDVIEMITHEDFYHAYHRIIFKAIEGLHEAGTPVDATTVISRLGDDVTRCGGVMYLAEIAHSTPSAVNLLAYAKTVLDKRRERDVFTLADKMKEAIMEDGESEDKINNALSLPVNCDYDTRKERTSNEVLKQVILDIEYRSTQKSGLVGLTTGFQDIDIRTAGLMPTDLIIVAARPAMGKTTFAMNLAQNSYDHGEGVTIVFSMEMSADQLMTRMVASAGGIALNRLRDGSLEDGDWASMNKAVINNKDKNLIIDDRPALTPQQVRAKAIKEKRKYGSLKMIVIDYLQLMKVNKSENRTNEVGEISRSLKALAKEMGCPVVALSQLSRNCESRQDKRPMMSDLRESGSIEQDADIIMFLYRDEVYNKESLQKGVTEVIFSKFRNGEIGEEFLKSELQYARFRDLPGYIRPVEEDTGFTYG